MNKLFPLFFIAVMLASVGACTSLGGGDKKEAEAPPAYPMDPEHARRARHGKITGDEGWVLFGGKKKNEEGGSGSGSGIGVNSYLWRATLDTLSFMPLASADPFGGVIITDWYEDPEAKGERFKVNVVILGKELRADGVRVSTFRQQKTGSQWQDAKVNEKTARDLEDKILTRAREMRIMGN